MSKTNRYKKTPYNAFTIQKRLALKRGLGWQFTFEEWVAWWEANLGPDWFKKRGHHTDEYVMARRGDVGPYAASNVRCALVQENHNDYNFNKPSSLGIPHRGRLRPDVVKAIYVSNDVYREIAKRYGLNVHMVHRVKCQKSYKAITDKLEKGSSR